MPPSDGAKHTRACCLACVHNYVAHALCLRAHGQLIANATDHERWQLASFRSSLACLFASGRMRAAYNIMPEPPSRAYARELLLTHGALLTILWPPWSAGPSDGVEARGIDAR